MENIKALRGFRDIYGEEIEKFALIEAASRKYLKLLGLQRDWNTGPGKDGALQEKYRRHH